MFLMWESGTFFWFSGCNIFLVISKAIKLVLDAISGSDFIHKSKLNTLCGKTWRLVEPPRSHVKSLILPCQEYIDGKWKIKNSWESCSSLSCHDKRQSLFTHGWCPRLRCFKDTFWHRGSIKEITLRHGWILSPTEEITTHVFHISIRRIRKQLTV